MEPSVGAAALEMVMALNAAADAPPLRTLHYDAKHPQEFLALYKASPFGQTAEFDLAASTRRFVSLVQQAVGAQG